MGDVWIKGNKFFCEHCKIHIHNNATSRKNHESSTKHTQAVANQLRNVLRKQDQKKRDEAKHNRIMGKIDAAALKSHRESDGGLPVVSAPSRSIPKTTSISLYGYGT
jgi:U1 zinc finger